MTSKKAKVPRDVALGLILEPKTPHEEVMFVVESNNEIVSEIIELIKYIFPKSYEDFKNRKDDRR